MFIYLQYFSAENTGRIWDLNGSKPQTDNVLCFSKCKQQATRHLFTPADRRIPRIRIETRQASTLVGQRIIVAIDGWPKNSRYPNVSLCRWAAIVILNIMSGLVLHQGGSGMLFSNSLCIQVAVLYKYGFSKWHLCIQNSLFTFCHRATLWGTWEGQVIRRPSRRFCFWSMTFRTSLSRRPCLASYPKCPGVSQKRWRPTVLLTI